MVVPNSNTPDTIQQEEIIANMADDSNSNESDGSSECDNMGSDVSFEEETDAVVPDKIISRNTNLNQSKGLANVMKSILNKQTTSKIILSKAKTDKERALNKVVKRKSEQSKDEIDEDQSNGTISFLKPKVQKHSDDYQSGSDENEDTIQDPTDGKENQLKKKAWENMARTKPDISDKTREKNLQRIATKGVVQLFNAVKQQQNLVNDMIEEAGPSERKKDKALKSISKGQFIDMLKGAPDQPITERSTKKEKKQNKKSLNEDVYPSDSTSNEKPSWSILRDDFMMGAKMKDWDKESDDDIYNDIDSNDDNCIET